MIIQNMTLKYRIVQNHNTLLRFCSASLRIFENWCGFMFSFESCIKIDSKPYMAFPSIAHIAWRDYVDFLGIFTDRSYSYIIFRTYVI